MQWEPPRFATFATTNSDGPARQIQVAHLNITHFLHA